MAKAYLTMQDSIKQYKLFIKDIKKAWMIKRRKIPPIPCFLKNKKPKYSNIPSYSFHNQMPIFHEVKKHKKYTFLMILYISDMPVLNFIF